MGASIVAGEGNMLIESAQAVLLVEADSGEGAGGVGGEVVAGDSAVVSTDGVVAVFVVAVCVCVDVVGAVAVTAVVSPVLTAFSSPQPRTSRTTRIPATSTPKALPMMMFRFFAVRVMFLPLGLERLSTVWIIPFMEFR